MKEVCAHEECTGCTACGSVCSKSAISFKQDRLGFLYPEINQEICINCGLCRKTCPNNSTVLKNSPIETYVGYATDIEEQKTSSSGGIASAISRWVIKNKGIVYGCYAESIDNICHIRVDREQDLIKLKGSKYVQSNMRDCYTLVRKDLIKGRIVLFVGTPCQVAGLKLFLRKEYPNLVTIDFVCHGVPSQKILKESLASQNLSLINDNYNLSFRRKIKKGNDYISSYGLFVKGQKDHKNHSEYIYEGDYPKDLYITGFLSALFYRKSCYQCHYTTPERVSDITVGDYSDNDGIYRNMEGKDLLLSMITINTLKGKNIFDRLNKEIKTAQIDYKKLLEAQGQLQKPMHLHPNRIEFENNFGKQDFKTLVRHLLQSDLKRIKKIEHSRKIRHIIYSIPYLKYLLQIVRRK